MVLVLVLGETRKDDAHPPCVLITKTGEHALPRGSPFPVPAFHLSHYSSLTFQPFPFVSLSPIPKRVGKGPLDISCGFVQLPELNHLRTLTNTVSE